MLEHYVSIEAIDKNGDTALHICAINNSSNSLVTIINNFLKSADDDEDITESERLAHKETLKRALNIQNSIGNTVLHECALHERQTLSDRLRRTGLMDETLVNKQGKTARDIENKIKEEIFKEQIVK